LEPRVLLSGSVNVTDWDGDRAAITLAGEGTLSVDSAGLSAAGLHRINSIILTDTDVCNSILTVAVTAAPGGNGQVDIGSILDNPNSALKSLFAPQANIVGDGTGTGINIPGYVASMTINNALNGADIIAAQSGIYYACPLKSTLVFGDIGANTVVQFSSDIASLTARSFALTSSLNARSIGKITTTGNFQPTMNIFRQVGTITVGKVAAGAWIINRTAGAISVGSSLSSWTVTVSGALTTLSSKGDLFFSSITCDSLGSVSAKGSVGSAAGTATLNLLHGVDAKTAALGTLSAGSWIQNLTVKSAGNINSVSALGLSTVKLLAGVKVGVTGYLGNTTAGNYFASNATIGSVTVKGIVGTPGEPWTRHSVITADILASTVGKLSLFGPADGGHCAILGKTLAGIGITKPDGTKFTWTQTGSGTGQWKASDASDLVQVYALV
jgi:hypothetical protein